MVTKAELRKFLPRAKPALVAAIVEGWHLAETAGITAPQRVRQFLSNIAVETGGLFSISESMTYTTPQRLMKVWPSRFKTIASAKPYVRQPKKLAIKVYGGRMGNAPAPSDDGWIFRGGGMMQTTGREGYRKMGFEHNPAALRDPATAFETAVREWFNRGCNELADQDTTTAIRKKINGGTHGLSEVRKYLVQAAKVWPGHEEVADYQPSPAAPEAPPPAPKPTPVAEDTIIYVQTKLKELGYVEVGRADGKIGTMTKGAILAFRLENDLPLVPEIDNQLLSALVVAQPRDISFQRKTATPGEVRQEVPEVNANFLSKIISALMAMLSTVAAIVTGIFDQVEVARRYIDPLKAYAADIPGYVWLVLVAVIAVSIYVVARKGEKKGIEAFQKGERR